MSDEDKSGGHGLFAGGSALMLAIVGLARCGDDAARLGSAADDIAPMAVGVSDDIAGDFATAGSATRYSSNLDEVDAASHGDAIEVVAAPPRSGPNLALRNPADNLVQQHRPSELERAIDRVEDDAMIPIVEKVGARGGALTRSATEQLLRSELMASAQRVARERPALVEFEVLTGKLSIKSQTRIGAATIKAGDINLYTVAAAGGGLVFACRAIAQPAFQNCVETAVRKAFDGVAAEPASKPEKEKPA